MAPARATFQFGVQVVGEREIAADFRGLQVRSADFRPAWAAIRADIIRIEQKQFDSEGKFRSGGWKPLSENTISKKVGAGRDPRILHDTLDLVNSLTREGGDNQENVVTNSMMLFGTTLPYARIANSSRKIFDFNEADRYGWLRMLREWLMHGSVTHSGVGTRRLSTGQIQGRLDREMGQAIL